jgi:hypothetical protein
MLSTIYLPTNYLYLLQSILADRLTDDFLKHREQWVANLKTVCNNYYSDDKLFLISDGTSPSAINLSDPHAHTLEETRDVETAVVGRAVRGQSDVGSDPFQTIITSIEQLRTGINTQVVTVRFTRKIFTILLSYRVPMELCWVIFEYLVYSEGLRQVLLRDLVDNKEKLLVVHDHTIEAFMRDCDNYLSYRRKELSEVTLTKSSFLL